MRAWGARDPSSILGSPNKLIRRNAVSLSVRHVLVERYFSAIISNMIEFLKSYEQVLLRGSIVFFFLMFCVNGYIDYRENQNITARFTALEESLNDQINISANTNMELAKSITHIEESLSLAKSDSLSRSTSLSDALAKEQERVALLQAEQAKIGGTVGTLEKLSKTDPELLKKYSKIFFLNEHYTPLHLSEIAKEYLYSEKEPLYIHSDVMPYLLAMLNDAFSQNVKIYVKSAYRSFGEQSTLKNIYTITYGAGTANQFSADQGYSEHQLGTTVDLITTGLNGQLDGFGNTDAYEWLVQNAYRYGFILSYPEDNEYYVYEPWHWRFVGKALAQKLHDEHMNFYDMDQRAIDEYLVSIFD